MNVPSIILLGFCFLRLVSIYNLKEREQPNILFKKNVFCREQCAIVFKSDQKVTAPGGARPCDGSSIHLVGAFSYFGFNYNSFVLRHATHFEKLET